MSSDFDPAWYGAAYPAVARDIAAGRAADAADHYRRLGRHRGYLPNAQAERPAEPARPRSAFGGLWTDQANADDLVEGRLALGWIDEAEAAQLRAWIADGFVVLPNAVPEETLQRALDDLDTAFRGEIEGQTYYAEGLGYPRPWSPGFETGAVKAINIHERSPALLDAAFSPTILRFLHLVFERPPMATQSLGFLRGSAQDAHQDSRIVAYSNALHFAASWIALEDVTPGAGELFYYVGSHRLPDYLYAGRYKNQYDAARLAPDCDVTAEAQRHDLELPLKARELGMPEQVLVAKRGDAMIWSGDLAHGGKPISGSVTRRSVVTHYCPAEIAPLSFERRNREVRTHPSGAFYLIDP